VIHRGWGRLILAVPAYAWTAVFFLAPLALLVIYSFGQINILTFKVDFGWTIHNYTQIADRLYVDTILRSLALSLSATAICLVIGLPVAYYMSLLRGPLQYALLIAVIVPFWTSFIVRTYAWLNVLKPGTPLAGTLKHLGLDGVFSQYSPGAVMLGITTNYLPLMILPLFVAFERIDPRLREAAWDLGAGRGRAFARVMLPLAVPGIVAGVIMVGIPATGEYVIPSILGGGKTLMFGNVVTDQFESLGNYPFGAALSVSVMSLLTIVLLILRRKTAALEDAS